MSRPELTIKEAAEATQTHRRTITRRLEAGKLPNAYKDDSGEWRIPVTDLEASGLRLYAPAGPNELPQAMPYGTPQGIASSEVVAEAGELSELKAELSEWRRRAEVAEAVARERELALEDARLALRALTAGPAVQSPPVEAGEVPQTSAKASAGPFRTSWWRRFPKK